MLVTVAGQGSYRARPFPPDRKKIDIGDYYSDCRLIGRKLGWKPRTNIRQALAQTVAYYRQELPHYL
jgi:UDP-glucose 4-epimerase